ncbi:M15 family metallopeptidase [Agarivorans sp. QJM3NY_33]|uniref:M15 family metallopeptidase n=1 Tax=Agarivorans sp. QJM3NY_33 TaxID=3421432 RepID=UPI003D7E4B66
MNHFVTRTIPEQALPDWKALQEIQICDNNEPLEPMSLSSSIKVYPAYHKMQIRHAISECFVRGSVFERLIEAEKLLPTGIHLVILDAWRPFPVQQYLFDTLMNLMEHANPELSPQQCNDKARNLVSPPSTDPKAPSPHLTGGSVDVTLCDQHGRLLNMGTLFDEASDDSWTAALERPALSKALQLAQQNRRLLYHAMTNAGFSNLASEWWHYDYGNQLWALATQQSCAFFGATRPSGIERLWQQQLQR